MLVSLLSRFLPIYLNKLKVDKEVKKRFINAAVIPLKRNNEDLVRQAFVLKNKLQQLKAGRVLMENSGNIGKSYRRHDEVGTPMCITIDFQTLEDKTVTVRDRDTMEQIRVPLEEIETYFQKRLN